MPKAKKKAVKKKDNVVSIGYNVRLCRNKRGLTQKQLGEKIGLTRETIASYEAGRARLTDVNLLKISTALRVSVNDILKTENADQASNEHQKKIDDIITRRWAKRIHVIESLPESIKKHILRALDDMIKANTHKSIFED